MKIENFVWLPHIVDKLVIKHQVECSEVEEIFESKPKCDFCEREIARAKMSTWPWDKVRQAVI